MSHVYDDCPGPEKKLRRVHGIGVSEKDISGSTVASLNDVSLKTQSQINDTCPDNEKLNKYSTEEALSYTAQESGKLVEIKGSETLPTKHGASEFNKHKLQNSEKAAILCQTCLPYPIPTSLFVGSAVGSNIPVCNLANVQLVKTSLGCHPQTTSDTTSACNLGSVQLVNVVQPVCVSTIPNSTCNSLAAGTVTPVSESCLQSLPNNDKNEVILNAVLLEPTAASVNRDITSTLLSGECNISDRVSPTIPQSTIDLNDSAHESVLIGSHAKESLRCGTSSERTDSKQSISDDVYHGNSDARAEDVKVQTKIDAFKLSQEESCNQKIEKNDKLRPLRKSQRKGRSCDSVVCPVCRTAIKLCDITEHLSVETARLNKWAQDYHRKQKSRRHTAEASNTPGQTALANHKDRYQSFLRVKHKRQERGSSTSKRGSGTGTQCPVCNEHISGTQYQLNQHVEKCLLKDNADIDVEGSGDSEDATEGYEEYEWAGQTRIRATSLLPGSSLAESGFVVGQKSAEAEDIELDIEDDETDIYGKAQYNEADLIPCTADEPEEESGRQAIRDILIQESSQSSSTSGQRSLHITDKWSSEEETTKDGSQCAHTIDLPIPGSSSQEVPGTSQIKKQEKTASGSDKYRCLICMETYDSPATSIQCWHVYCEECWLRTLGAKKLCPQCNVITHPSDLRRIYL